MTQTYRDPNRYLCISRARVIQELRAVGLKCFYVHVKESDVERLFTRFEVLVDCKSIKPSYPFGRLLLLAGMLRHVGVYIEVNSVHGVSRPKRFVVTFDVTTDPKPIRSAKAPVPVVLKQLEF